MNLIETTVTVRNRAGLHTRPAAGLVKMCAKYKCDIYFSRDGFEINAKSIIGVMTLAAEQGCIIDLKAEGVDANEAVTDIKAYFDDGFGEPV